MTGEGRRPTVVGYLRALDLAGRDLPKALRADLRAHTVSELVAKVGDSPGEAELAAAVAELDRPAEVVEAARLRYGLEADPLRSRDSTAGFLLGTGPFLLGLGALAGLVLLWVPRGRPLRQRIIATGLLALGTVVPVVVARFALPALDLPSALLFGGLALGPWAAAAYLAALRFGQQRRATRQVERQNEV